MIDIIDVKNRTEQIIRNLCAAQKLVAVLTYLTGSGWYFVRRSVQG